MRACRERKRYLSGEEVVFECELVALEDGLGVLKYMIEQQWQVQSLTLRPGTVTYAFYWIDRPYSLYWWLGGNGETVGHYFNLADSVELSPQEFVWRDLVVDILVKPGGQVWVIDEDEVPDELDEGLQGYVESGKRQVLRDHESIIAEASAELSRLVSSPPLSS